MYMLRLKEKSYGTTWDGDTEVWDNWHTEDP